MTLASVATVAGSSTPPKYGTEYRTDLQGLRAIAVLFVLLFHAQFPLFGGGFIGVDIFFVLSGFLITGIVAKEITNTQRFSLVGFYARRVIRIVPAATLVLVSTVAASYFLMPATQWSKTAWETIGSAFYFSNWQFAASTNYLNAEAIPSPLQHFWSLAVEEQYYLLWPALLALAILILRSSSREANSKKILTAALAIMLCITFLSFVFVIIAMQKWPAAAYFVTPSRLWELGVGSLIALYVPRLRALNAVFKRALLVTGLGAMFFAGIFYNNGTPFPGVTALVPVLGAGAVIVSGLTGSDGRQIWSFLNSRLLVWFGNISYALYLWHWPILIFAEYLIPNLTLPQRLMLIATSILPAYLSTRFVEKPLTSRQWFRERPARSIYLGIIAMLVSATAASALLFTTTAHSSGATPNGKPALGAAALADGEPLKEVTEIPHNLTPSLLNASADNPAIYADGCHLEFDQDVPKVCSYGDVNGPLVLLTGDSHAAQWFPALNSLAESNRLNLVVMTKSSCPFISGTVLLESESRSYYECSRWNENVQKYIAENKPMAVFTSNLGRYELAVGKDQPLSLANGFSQAWTTAASNSKRFVVIADTPYMKSNVPDCLASNMKMPAKCDTPRAEAIAFSQIEAQAAKTVPEALLIDLNDKICPSENCTTIIGDVLVYRDQHHLTASYAKTLGRFLAERSDGIFTVE